MQTYLQPGVASPERKTLILGGIGGIGKTQLAISYAKRHRRDYSSIFWLNAASETKLKSSFRTLVERIPAADRSTSYTNIDDNNVRTIVLNWLSELDNTGWLLIFDNYDEPEQYSIKSYYPYSFHGSIIVTTRLAHKVGINPLVLRPLSNVDEGLEILQKRSQREGVQDG